MNIYLDVDGVLLKHDGTLASHADEFLTQLIAGGHPVHWLTTRCRDGNAAPVVEVLSRLVQPPTAELLPSIRPTSWATSKLEAIDLASPFIWFDDQPLQFEIEELEECGLLDRWAKIDLVSEPDQLAALRLSVESQLDHREIVVEPTPRGQGPQSFDEFVEGPVR